MTKYLKITQLWLLGLVMSASLAYGQERNGPETVTFDFSCPVLTHEVLPHAVTPHLNNETRTTIGVGEQVDIFSSKKVLNWEVVNPTSCSGEIIFKGDKKCTYEASVDACDEVIIRATFSGSCPPQEKKFIVIAPTDIVFQKKCGYHEQGAYDVGLITNQVSVKPANVSFAYLSLTEKEAFAKGTGSLVLLTGQPHNASGVWTPCTYIMVNNIPIIGQVDGTQGTLLPGIGEAIDDAYLPLSIFGIANGTPPNPNLIGTVIWKIPWNYAKSTKLHEERLLQKVAQIGSIDFDSTLGENTMQMTKKTETHKIKISEKTILPVFDPNTNNAVDCK